jgi:hypothetical protein
MVMAEKILTEAKEKTEGAKKEWSVVRGQWSVA